MGCENFKKFNILPSSSFRLYSKRFMDLGAAWGGRHSVLRHLDTFSTKILVETQRIGLQINPNKPSY